MPIRLLLFDIDGTLLLTGGAGKIAFERAMLDLFGVREAWGQIVPDGKTDPLIIQEIFHACSLSLTPDHYEKLCDLYHRYFEQEIERAPHFRLMPGIPELLDELSRCCVPLLAGVATGNFERAALLKLKRGNLDSYFKFGGYGSDSENRFELTRLAFERGRALCGEGVNPCQAVVIGDTVHDIRAGKRLGALTVAVATGSTSIEELQKERPDLALADLRDTRSFLSFLA